MNKARLKGVLAVVLASLCYGVTPMLTNIAIKGGVPFEFAARVSAPASIMANPSFAMPNESVVAFCMLFGCLFALMGTAVSSKKGMGSPLRAGRAEALSMALAGGGSLMATLLLISYAYLYMEPGSVIVLHFCYPAIACLTAALFFKERFSVLKGLAAGAAVSGVYLVSGFSGAENAAGPLLAVLSAFTYAAYFILGRHGPYKNVSPSVSSVYITGAASLMGFLAALATGRLAAPATWFLWLVLALDGVLGYLIGLRLLLYGIRILGSGNAAMLNALEPVMATVMGVIVYGETVGAAKGLGCAMVIASAVIVVADTGRKKRKYRPTGKDGAETGLKSST